MEVDEAIRFPAHAQGLMPRANRETLDELLDLARWAPNHHLTNPWRFRVLGPGVRAAEACRLPGGGDEGIARRLCRLLVCIPDDEVQAEEDLHATSAIAAYIVLLAAHARGLVGYWRTPGVLRDRGGREAVGLAPEERFVALIHLGHPQEKAAPEREPALR